MSTNGLIQAFDSWRHTGEPMVLATVYETKGSTYSKAGHRILIASNLDYQGLVSGGCLEGDLAERAKAVIDANEPTTITYDMRDDADDLWGLGVGCNGLIRVFLQPLTAIDGYEPFSQIVENLKGSVRKAVATVINSNTGNLPVGATLLWADGDNVSKELKCLQAGCHAALNANEVILSSGENEMTVLYSPLQPIRRILVLGAGLDALPVVNMASELGWRVTIADHRKAYLEKGIFELAERSMLIEPEQMSQELNPGSFDAVIVMSHHLLTDQVYLEQLAEVNIGYIGVLGPADRKKRLLDSLDSKAATLRKRLKGPVGLDIGATDPESIALSLLAEIHATFACKVG
ncbi:MAG: xanthine dehydrogenase [Rhodospirillaceae bacterium]|nr:xanthine dehydrogenase [Rhodospirillaceae bacterium]|tara:strand:- start:6428 stop:7468 length:1041 start_codon:yes stop_codon:yes gene_type:complete